MYDLPYDNELYIGKLFGKAELFALIFVLKCTEINEYWDKSAWPSCRRLSLSKSDSFTKHAALIRDKVSSLA